ncbi:hypothetical protein CPB86DRAFT_378813 [Serendipita vermifera]|nr:hypothetical protein CPB86DRAFT_378813 [Serendipita vermifera]
MHLNSYRRPFMTDNDNATSRDIQASCYGPVDPLGSETNILSWPLSSRTTTRTTPMAAPGIYSTAIKLQTARFACSTCGKTFTSRPRADTCLFNHMGIKPFTCNGGCGLFGCPMRYASRALLTRHCTSFGEKMLICPRCHYISSKQNFARHRRGCNQ